MRAKRKQFRVKVEKYTVNQFNEQFPDDAACLADIFRRRYPNGLACDCGRKDKLTPIAGRRAYSCVCGFQVYPTAGSVFHKSTTPLKTWYFAMFLMQSSRNGVAALELQRQIGVTYKTAWRMMHQIRALMSEEAPYMTGTVEVDETYVGGKRPGKRGRGAAGKTAIVGALERGGNILPVVVERTDAATVEAVIELAASKGAKINTDEYGAYNGLQKLGYAHDTVNHGNEQWTKGDVHTQNIEGFWSQLKRSIDGTHHHVSKKHLQKYADEFAFRFNRRKSSSPMFLHLVSQMSEQRA